MPSRTIVWTLADDDRQYRVEVMDDGARQEARVEQRVYEVARAGRGLLRIASDCTTTAWTVAAGDVRWVFVDGRVFELAEARPRERARGGAHHGALTAPMPATVLRVLVKAGDAVKRGDSLVILEAMKMEHHISAPYGGSVTEVRVAVGDQVDNGTLLLVLDETP